MTNSKYTNRYVYHKLHIVRVEGVGEGKQHPISRNETRS